MRDHNNIATDRQRKASHNNYEKVPNTKTRPAHPLQSSMDEIPRTPQNQTNMNRFESRFESTFGPCNQDRELGLSRWKFYLGLWKFFITLLSSHFESIEFQVWNWQSQIAQMYFLIHILIEIEIVQIFISTRKLACFKPDLTNRKIMPIFRTKMNSYPRIIIFL